MGNGTSTGQGNYTPYGLRDVTGTVEQEQHHWPSEALAKAPNIERTNSLLPIDRNCYIGAQLRGQKSSNLPNSTEDREDNNVRNSNIYSRAQVRSKKTLEDVGAVRAEDNGVRARRKKSMDEVRILHCRSQPTHILTPALVLPLIMQKKRSQPTRMMMPVFALPLIMQKKGFLPGSQSQATPALTPVFALPLNVQKIEDTEESTQHLQRMFSKFQRVRYRVLVFGS